MENHKEEQKDKAPDNEHYDVENPQNIAQPKFNSTSTHRGGAELPAVENLNQIKEEKTSNEEKKSTNSGSPLPQNDESLHGKNTKTDLGGGQRDDDEDEDEKIIRT